MDSSWRWIWHSHRASISCPWGKVLVCSGLGLVIIEPCIDLEVAPSSFTYPPALPDVRLDCEWSGKSQIKRMALDWHWASDKYLHISFLPFCSIAGQLQLQKNLSNSCPQILPSCRLHRPVMALVTLCTRGHRAKSITVLKLHSKLAACALPDASGRSHQDQNGQFNLLAEIHWQCINWNNQGHFS